MGKDNSNVAWEQEQRNANSLFKQRRTQKSGFPTFFPKSWAPKQVLEAIYSLQ